MLPGARADGALLLRGPFDTLQHQTANTHGASQS